MKNVGSPRIVRSTVNDTLKWFLPDIPIRFLPSIGIPLLYILLFHRSPMRLGLSFKDGWHQLLLGIAIGLIMASLAIVYRIWIVGPFIVGPWLRWPTLNDQVFQFFILVIVNAPIEEFFFRGFLLDAMTQLTGGLVWGWLISSLAYTFYHRLGRWNWRSIGGVAIAGLVFSFLYLDQPEPRSLLLVSIVHGFTTCGFLSWGDEVTYRLLKHKSISDTSAIE